jgi:glutaminyl-peptide cyclotransferase
MSSAGKPVSLNIFFIAVLTLFSGNAFLGGCLTQDLPDFNSQRAFEILEKQCEFGPRQVGSKAHEQACDYLYSQLKPLADSVVLQKFKHEFRGKTYELTNIIAEFGKDGEHPGILLCAHWDTRPYADQELEEEKRKIPILGANDGASGVAVLIELAYMFNRQPPKVPVTIVLFDGEDFGPTSEHMFLGSKYFASTVRRNSFKYGILLDMIGDKELNIYRERFSEDSASWVNDKIWATAKKLGYGRVFRDQVKYKIGDDHLPLIEAGIPCVDVIDFDYAYWHTLKDTVDKCSPESLKTVGEVISRVVYSEKN